MRLSIKRGSIVWVDLGKTRGDNIQRGKRLAIVIQNNMGNKHSTTSIIVPLTTQIKKIIMPTHFTLKSKHYNFLKKDNMILAEQIRTVNKNNILRVIGVLEKDDMIKLNRAIYNSIMIA